MMWKTLIYSGKMIKVTPFTSSFILKFRYYWIIFLSARQESYLGTMKGNDLVPSHELRFTMDSIVMQLVFSLNEKEALQYLRCENVFLPAAPKGWVLASFDGFALGWMKGIGSRINNYFPRSQR